MALDMQCLYRFFTKNINHKPVHARSRKKRDRLTRLRLEIEHQSSENHELKTTIMEEQGHNQTSVTEEQLSRSRGKMPEPEYGKIKGNIMMFKEGIYPGDYITHLFEKKVLTDDEYERLKTIENRPMACVEAMLYIVLRCGLFGFKELMVHMKKENPSLLRKLYPDNSTSYCNLKYPNENHEVILDLEREEHTEFKQRTTKYLEETLNDKLPKKQMVSIRSLTKGCVQVTFEILSLDKTDKDKLQAVLEKAVKSGYIGPDAVAANFTFNSVKDDDLTDAEVEKEIRRLEEVKQRLKEEHDHLLSLRKTPKSSALAIVGGGLISSTSYMVGCVLNWTVQVLQNLGRIYTYIGMLGTEIIHEPPLQSDDDEEFSVKKDEILQFTTFTEYENPTTLKDETSPEDTSSIESKDIQSPTAQ